MKYKTGCFGFTVELLIAHNAHSFAKLLVQVFFNAALKNILPFSAKQEFSVERIPLCLSVLLLLAALIFWFFRCFPGWPSGDGIDKCNAWLSHDINTIKSYFSWATHCFLPGSSVTIWIFRLYVKCRINRKRNQEQNKSLREMLGAIRDFFTTILVL